MEFCPKCNANLQSEPIPKEQQKDYRATHFTRKIGVSSIEWDMVVRWQCPDCKYEWKR